MQPQREHDRARERPDPHLHERGEEEALAEELRGARGFEPREEQRRDDVGRERVQRDAREGDEADAVRAASTDELDGGLARHELEVAAGEEARADEQPKQDRDKCQADRRTRSLDERTHVYAASNRRTGPLDQGARVHAASPAPVAAIIRLCSVHSDAGRAGPRRPRCITAIRSQSPSSSGK